MIGIYKMARDYGWLLGIFGFALGILSIIIVLNIERGVIDPVTPIGDKIMITAAVGVEGFKTTEFCNSPGATASGIQAPDASGITYEIRRVLNGKTETVVFVLDSKQEIQYAKHFYDTSVNQDSEPAVIDKDALACAKRKAGTR